MPKKAKKLALYGLLSMRAKDQSILGFTGFLPKTPKTKEAATLLSNIGIANKKVLVVVEGKNDAVTKSFRNIDKTKYIYLDYLNPFDVMHSDCLLFTKEALEKINQSK